MMRTVKASLDGSSSDTPLVDATQSRHHLRGLGVVVGVVAVIT